MTGRRAARDLAERDDAVDRRRSRTLASCDVARVAAPAAVVPLHRRPPRVFRNFSVCGDRLAVTIHERGQSELWVGSLDRAALTRITGDGSAFEPTWKQGCETITFGWNRDGRVRDSRGHARETANRRARCASAKAGIARAPQIPGSWSADGRLLAYVEPHPVTRHGDIWILDTSTGHARAR